MRPWIIVLAFIGLLVVVGKPSTSVHTNQPCRRPTDRGSHRGRLGAKPRDRHVRLLPHASRSGGAR